jgi:two-component system NtrC family response regulator
MPGPRILLIDADQGERDRLREALVARGFDAVGAPSLVEGIAMASGFRPDGALVGPADGGSLVRALRAGGSDAAVVVSTPPGEAAAGLEALRQGAEGLVPGPLEPARVAAALEKALEARGLRREWAALRAELRRRAVLVGGTREMLLIQEIVRRAAPTKAAVLVQGEVGTGREAVAQAIHESSPRRDRAFVRARCAGLSGALVEGHLFGCEAGVLPHAPQRTEGRVAAAAGGTLFLQEVASLPPPAQVRLLRLLQHGEYERLGGRETLRADVRVVASTAHDLAEEVRQGRFRDDLYYRLGVVALALPPLRQRKGDIPALADHFLARAARSRGEEAKVLSPGALSALYAYDWPGNVRELAAEVEEAAARCPGREIATSHLSPVLRSAGPDDSASALIPGASLAEIEREAILRTLDEVGGSTARAARLLGVSVRKIQYKLKEYRGGELRRRAAGPPGGLGGGEREPGVDPVDRAKLA